MTESECLYINIFDTLYQFSCTNNFFYQVEGDTYIPNEAPTRSNSSFSSLLTSLSDPAICSK